MIPGRANSIAVGEGMLSRFFQATAAASTIGHVCQARSEVQVEKGQRVSCKPPGEREPGIVQEARTQCPIPMGEDFIRRPAVPVAGGSKRRPRLIPDIVPSKAVKGHWTQKVYARPNGIHGQMVLRPLAYVDLRSLDFTWGEEKSDSPFVSTPCPPSRIGPSMRVFQWASGSPDQAYSDLSTTLHPSNLVRDCCSASRRALARGSTGNRYRQSVKRKMYTAHASACPLRKTPIEARFPPGHRLQPILPTNFAPVGGRARTTPRGCERVRHSSGRAIAGYRYPSRHWATNLRFCQNWPWLLLFVRTQQPSFS